MAQILLLPSNIRVGFLQFDKSAIWDKVLGVGADGGGKTQLIWDFCAFLRKDGFFDNLFERYIVKT